MRLYFEKRYKFTDSCHGIRTTYIYSIYGGEIICCCDRYSQRFHTNLCGEQKRYDYYQSPRNFNKHSGQDRSKDLRRVYHGK